MRPEVNAELLCDSQSSGIRWVSIARKQTRRADFQCRQPGCEQCRSKWTAADIAMADDEHASDGRRGQLRLGAKSALQFSPRIAAVVSSHDHSSNASCELYEIQRRRLQRGVFRSMAPGPADSREYSQTVASAQFPLNPTLIHELL